MPWHWKTQNCVLSGLDMTGASALIELSESPLGMLTATQLPGKIAMFPNHSMSYSYMCSHSHVRLAMVPSPALSTLPRASLLKTEIDGGYHVVLHSAQILTHNRNHLPNGRGLKLMTQGCYMSELKWPVASHTIRNKHHSFTFFMRLSLHAHSHIIMYQYSQ